MKKICVFCNTSSVDDDLGPFYQLSDYNFHSNCLVFSSDIRQNPDKTVGLNGFEVATIEFTLHRGQKRRCYWCWNFGATVKCSGDGERRCDVTYHLPCALESKTTCHEYFNSHRSYCYECIPYTCIFDYERVTGIAIRTDCCSQIYSHDKCIEKYVQIAKALTKCPLCYDEKTFQNFIRTNYTVKISKKNPSYARWRDSETTVVCAAESCVCPEPDGRLYNQGQGSNSPFELIDCSFCGSEAIHRFCGDVEMNNEWVCRTCDLESRPQLPQLEVAAKTKKRSRRAIKLLVRIGLWLGRKLFPCLSPYN